MKRETSLAGILHNLSAVCLIMLALFMTTRAQSVSIQYQTTADYNTGFNGEITINNTGTQTIDGWTLALDMNRAINSLYSATLVSHVGTRYTFRNAGFNNIIPAGGSVTFGFTATPGNLSATPVSNYTFNGSNLGLTATTFSYQGRLSDGSAAASGVYDLQFVLYTDTGTQVGQTLQRDDVTVTNGIFMTLLDFGANAFPGANRQIEIRVRRGAETGAFTALTPRQPISAAPYAINSLNAAQLGGVAANQYVLTTDARLTTTFDVSGNGAVGGNLTVSGNISSGCRNGFTTINGGRLCVSAMQTTATFWNAVTVCKNLSARIGNSADVMQSFSEGGFNYFGGLPQGWLADHIGDDTWATWNVTAPNSNFDGAATVVSGTNAPTLPFRCVY